MDKDYEHPDIAAALRTGYPERRRAAAYCTRCGAGVEPGDSDYDKLAVQGEDCLCKDCLEAEIEELSVWEIARALGFEIVRYMGGRA